MVITSVRTAVESRTIVRRFNIATRAGSATRATRRCSTSGKHKQLSTKQTNCYPPGRRSGRGFAAVRSPSALAQFVRVFETTSEVCLPVPKRSQNNVIWCHCIGSSPTWCVLPARPPVTRQLCLFSCGTQPSSEFAQTSSNSNALARRSRESTTAWQRWHYLVFSAMTPSDGDV